MTALARIPARTIIAAIADTAERWADADFPPRVRLLDAIQHRTGYSVPTIEYALDQLFSSISRDALEATIIAELGSIDVLDDFGPRGDMRMRAIPVGRAAVISSRTTIGVALVPAIFALCAKCDVVVKDREDGLVGAFFRTLAQEHDVFALAATAQSWNGEERATDLGAFDVVVAFGSDATMASIRAHLAPLARFIPFASKASIGYIGRAALTAASLDIIAPGAARDLVLYETQGCLSLHELFVETGGEKTPKDAAAYIASAIERVSVEFPLGTRDASTSARIASARDLAAFRASAGTGASFSDARASFVVMLDPPAHEPPALLGRTLAVRSVDGPADALAQVRRHALPLEALAVAGAREDIVNMALDMGVSRIAGFGDLQRPPLGTTHGGRPRIAEFLRFVSAQP